MLRLLFATLQTRTVEEQDKAEKRLLKRQVEKKRKLQASGIDYDFGPVAYVCCSYFSNLVVN